MNGESNWYASKGVWGSVVALLAGALGAFGVILEPDLQEHIVVVLVAFGSAIGGAIALWGRITAKTKIAPVSFMPGAHNIVLGAFGLAVALSLLTACNTLRVDDEGRKAAALTLITYDTAQQGLIIYGSLPDCGPTLIYICKDRALWVRLKETDKAATLAIVAAQPVLRGDLDDVGQVAAAVAAIDDVKAAWTAVRAAWKKGGVQ